MSAVILASDEGQYGIERAIKIISSGGSGLDALEAAVRAVEDDKAALTVGFGGAPNALGAVQCDAAVMNGETLQSGAIGALSGFRNPVSVARKVMEKLPHVMLVGEGAERFAAEIGAEKAQMLSEEARQLWLAWLKKHNLSASDLSADRALLPLMSFATRKNLSLGTVVFLLREESGQMWAATSTTGWSYKYPGRLGDSPVVGAGLYVDQRYGGAVCTHTGEMTIRCSSARSVVLYMKKGADLKSACHEALDDLKYLKGGYLGPVIIHGMSRDGEVYALSTGGESGEPCWWWQSGMAEHQALALNQ